MYKLRVKEILKEKRITGRELALKLGMTEVGLYKAMGDSGNPPLKRLSEIAAALGVPITDLFERPKNDTVNCPHCGGKIKIGKE